MKRQPAAHYAGRNAEHSKGSSTLRLKFASAIHAAATISLALWMTACAQAPAAVPNAQGPMALPVKVEVVALKKVPVSDTYVATIKSRRSATIQPQVSGNLTAILIHSGDRVQAGQRLMEIDPREQQAIVEQQASTEQQKLAVYQYNQDNVARQRKLFAAGIISQDANQQAEQAYRNAKADYDSATAARKTAQQQLTYYHISAPFAGVVGDIPVHVGDYVSPTTTLTTVDENKQLEAYIYIPAERAGQIRIGLPVDLTDTQGNVLDRSTIKFISPQVDTQLQGILAKADVHATENVLRNAQMVRARVIWSMASAPTIPVLAVIREGGQAFVYVAQPADGKFVARLQSVVLGDATNNTYAVKDGLHSGDRVILSGTQMLVDGAPVQPLP